MPYIIQLYFASYNVLASIDSGAFSLYPVKSWTDILIPSSVIIFSYRKNKSVFLTHYVGLTQHGL